MRFAKLSSSVTSFQVHASEDSTYAILPIYETGARIVGWRVYNSITGELSETFETLLNARTWVNDLLVIKETA